MDESFLYILLAIALFFVIRKALRNLHSRFDDVTAEMQRLKAQVQASEKESSEKPIQEILFELKQIRLTLNARQFPADPTSASPTADEFLKPQEPLVAPQPETTKNISPLQAPVKPPIAEPVLASLEPKEAIIREKAAAQVPPVNNPLPVAEENTPTLLEKFLQNNPDLEKFIGENLINKIGIAILVLGIGYFVKFAIDKDWINEIGRVFIGILAGGLLIGLAHRLRHTLSAFSSVLVGGGLSVLYFTIAIAFHEYQLFSQIAAFSIMVVITGFSILLSISYNRVELAVVSLIGGFATPFMLSTGAGNYHVLFTYILILNLGMLLLAYLKGWKIINWVAYGFTVLLYGGWLTTKVLNEPVNAPYMGALFFGALFYLIFFLMNMVNNIRNKTAFIASEISILLSNTLFYYAAGMAVLAHVEQGLYQGLFTVLLGVFNFVFAFVLFKNNKVDRTLIYLLLGLVITFISLAVPVQLEGNYVTMFWALEAVLLWWLGIKSGLKFIFLSSVIVIGLMLMSLLMDWGAIYLDYSANAPILPVLLNKGFITSLLAIISLLVTWQLIKKQTEPIHYRFITIHPAVYRKIIGFVAGGVIYLTLALELTYQLNIYLPSSLSRNIIILCYNLAFILSLLLLARYQADNLLLRGATWLGAISVLFYGLVGVPLVYNLLKNYFLGGQHYSVGFGFHYLGVVLVLFILICVYRNRMVFAAGRPTAPKILLWLGCLLLVLLASSELVYHIIIFNLPEAGLHALNRASNLPAAYDEFNALVRQINKVGFPILWGLCAFIFMYTGLKKKNKNLRVISLALFSVTLLKLFVYDIQGISEGGKIAAFISLGVLLLVISFMYQNIKRLILVDESAPVAANGEEK